MSTKLKYITSSLKAQRAKTPLNSALQKSQWMLKHLESSVLSFQLRVSCMYHLSLHTIGHSGKTTVLNNPSFHELASSGIDLGIVIEYCVENIDGVMFYAIIMLGCDGVLFSWSYFN